MSEIPLNQRFLIVSEVIRLTEKAFAHWENALIAPEQLESLAEEFFDKAAKAERRVDFQIVMWEYFGKLRNVHSNYFDRGASFPYGGMFNISLHELKGEWVVKEAISGLLEAGDIVKSFSGRPIQDWLNELSHLTGIMEWRAMSARLPIYLSYLVTEEKVDVETINQDGLSRTFELSRTPLDIEALNQGDTTGKWLIREKSAYIHIPSFNHSRFEEKALSLLAEYRNANSIIIDVRGNSGGSTPSKLVQHLMNQPYRWWNERARHPEHLSRRHQDAEIFLSPDYSYAEYRSNYIKPENDSMSYEGRLIILVDRYTGSAAEDFVMPFLDNGRATIVGERTCGSTGQPVFRNFDNNNISVMVGAIRSFFPNGTLFEGVGIAPQIEVVMQREDFYYHRDVVLEKALEVLS